MLKFYQSKIKVKIFLNFYIDAISKNAILRNRQNINILENIGNWLHIRGRLVNAFNEFIFPSTAWTSKEQDDTVKENLTKNKRENDKLQEIMNHIAERMKVNFDDISFHNCSKELESFDGKKLAGKVADKRLLDSRRIGEIEYRSFVESRMINRTIPIMAKVKKTNIPVFPYLDLKKKPKPKKNTERKELMITNKLLSILSDRPLIQMSDLNKYQLSPIHSLVKELDSTGKQVPNFRGNKSSAINDFMFKQVPEAFKNERPADVNLVILEGENILACQ